MTYEEAVATLALKTSMSVMEWQDFFAATPVQQAAIAQAYREAEWVKNGNVFADVMAVLNVLATIAGVVSGVSGAVSAVASLRALS